MTIKYRKRDATGDYVFGQSQDDFYNGIEAVTQACTTRMELWEGTWWRDLNDGTPFMQSILGTRGNPQNLQAIESILQGRILGTPDVVGISNAALAYTPATRSMIYTGNVQTAYSEAPIVLEL